MGRPPRSPNLALAQAGTAGGWRNDVEMLLPRQVEGRASRCARRNGYNRKAFTSVELAAPTRLAAFPVISFFSRRKLAQRPAQDQTVPGMRAARGGLVHAPVVAHTARSRRPLCLPGLLQARDGNAQSCGRTPLTTTLARNRLRATQSPQQSNESGVERVFPTTFRDTLVGTLSLPGKRPFFAAHGCAAPKRVSRFSVHALRARQPRRSEDGRSSVLH